VTAVTGVLCVWCGGDVRPSCGAGPRCSLTTRRQFRLHLHGLGIVLADGIGHLCPLERSIRLGSDRYTGRQ
jgi:hypothetical protein